MCLCLVYQWILIIGNNAGLTGNPHVIHFSTILGFQDQASYFLSLGQDCLILPPLFIRLCTVSLIVYWYQWSFVRWLEKRPPLMIGVCLVTDCYCEWPKYNSPLLSILSEPHDIPTPFLPLPWLWDSFCSGIHLCLIDSFPNFVRAISYSVVCLCNLLIWFEHSFVDQIVRYTCTTGIRHMFRSLDLPLPVICFFL